MSKKKCTNCRKKIGLLTFDCKYCNGDFCSSCRDMNVHKCKGLDDCKKRKLSELENKLNSEKVESEKLIKI